MPAACLWVQRDTLDAWRHLAKLAKRRKTTRGALINEAIRQYVALAEAPPEQELAILRRIAATSLRRPPHGQ